MNNMLLVLIGFTLAITAYTFRLTNKYTSRDVGSCAILKMHTKDYSEELVKTARSIASVGKTTSALLSTNNIVSRSWEGYSRY